MVEEDYRSWDRYSWFLYQHGRYEDSKQASDKALAIAKSLEMEDMVELIESHNNKIITTSWDSFAAESK